MGTGGMSASGVGVKILCERARDTRGANTGDAAHWLGCHLISHDCGVSQAIVDDLLSFEEMLRLQRHILGELIPLLEEKMKSI